PLAARRPDCSAPCIQPGKLDLCSPAKCTRASARSMPTQIVVKWQGACRATAPPAHGSAGQTFETLPSRFSISPGCTFSISCDTNSSRLSSDIVPTRCPTPVYRYETSNPLVPACSCVGFQISCGKVEMPNPL